MKQQIMQLALVVKDYDEAIAFFIKKLKFTLIEDTKLNESKRWVRISPPGSQNDCCLLLAKAVGEQQLAAVGNQTGGRVFLFLETDNFYRDYESMLKNGVEFVRAPAEESWGTVAVFRDLYGNLWDFIERKNDGNKRRL
jgi:uncharacterized glyoxalase superfamily protein PhnB